MSIREVSNIDDFSSGIGSLIRILHEKREKAWRDREPEKVVKPESDDGVIAAKILQIPYGRGIAAL